MVFVVVDAFGLGPGVARVAGFGARLFAAFGFGGGRVEGRLTAGRGVRGGFGSDQAGELEHLELDGDRILFGEGLGLVFGQPAGAEGVEKLGIEWDGGGGSCGGGCHTAVIT